MSGGVRKIFVRVRGADAAEAVLALLDDAAAAVSAFETAPEEWRLEAYSQSSLLTPDLSARLALAAAARGGEVIEMGERRLPDRDWLADNQLTFPPLRVGPFFVYGSHHRGAAPAGAIGIMLDAATAFGTGEHPSTRGCLLALAALARRKPIRHPLDIGTGTAILAIAAAKLRHRPVWASDIDAGSVAVARHNVACNGVASLVRVAAVRLSWPRAAPARLRFDPRQHPGAALGGDGRRPRAASDARRTRGFVGIVAAAGADRSDAASQPRFGARAADRHRRVVDPDFACWSALPKWR